MKKHKKHKRKKHKRPKRAITQRLRPARKAARPAGPPARIGSWRTAATELEAARRHLSQATAAIERLAAEMTALRETIAHAARLELARSLSAGPDGGLLTLLAKLAASPDAADAPLARVAGLILERLTAVLAPETPA